MVSQICPHKTIVLIVSTGKEFWQKAQLKIQRLRAR
jgi:hypothetical protein